VKLYVGWDVGGWHCDKNKASRDALVVTAVVDGAIALVGRPWRGNLRPLLVEKTGYSLVAGMLKLCAAEAECVSNVVVAIDTPLGWPSAMMKLALGGAASFVSPADGENPYTRRATELALIRRGFAPLSTVRDMLGSQSTKGIHFLRAAGLIEAGPAVWRQGYEGGRFVTAIETYPAVALRAPRLAALQATVAPASALHDDIRDALACSLVAHLYEDSPALIEAIPADVPAGEGWIVLPRCEGPKG
jgi:hypothetical protein